MAKVEITNDVFLPMPVALVGAHVDGRPNFMAAGWMTRVNVKPPMIAVSLSADHYTTKGVEENGTFSLCFPSKDLVEKTDYCGLVSGNEADKSAIFEATYGKLGTAPMAGECPFCMECRVVQTVPLGGDIVYVAEIVAAYADEGLLIQGVPDVKRMDLFFLTMPDNKYWLLGEELADAYSVGEGLMERE